MPRWLRENKDQRRDLLGFPASQTCVMDSSKATVIDGASEEEKLQQQLWQAEYNLQQFNKRKRVQFHTKGRLPLGAILATDVDEQGVLVYIGYRLEEGGDLIRFLKPFPCQPPRNDKK